MKHNKTRIPDLEKLHLLKVKKRTTQYATSTMEITGKSYNHKVSELDSGTPI